MEKLSIAIYVLFYNNNSKKYQESRENQGAVVIIPSGLKTFRSQNITFEKLYETLVKVIVKFDSIYSELSYNSFKVQYFAAKNSHYDTFFPNLKRISKNCKLDFPVQFRKKFKASIP